MIMKKPPNFDWDESDDMIAGWHLTFLPLWTILQWTSLKLLSNSLSLSSHLERYRQDRLRKEFGNTFNCNSPAIGSMFKFGVQLKHYYLNLKFKILKWTSDGLLKTRNVVTMQISFKQYIYFVLLPVPNRANRTGIAKGGKRGRLPPPQSFPRPFWRKR